MIIKYDELSEIRDKHKGERVVFAGGTFDILHAGHLDFLKLLRESGDVVVVAVSSDRRVKERKGDNRPIQKQRTRLKVIEALKYVDYALVAPYGVKYGQYPTVRIVNALEPDLFITRDKRWLAHKHKIESSGATLLIDSLPKRDSTSRIIRKALAAT